MILKWIFDRSFSFIGLCFLWPILLIVAILVKIKMPGDLRSLCRREWARAANCLTVTNFAQ